MLNGEIRAVAPYGRDLTKLDVNLTPEQSSTPSLMPETNSVYLSRPTEGTGELMELVGGSVAWNQLCNSSSVTGTSGHKFYLKKSGVESITNTNTFTGLASGTDMVTDLTQMLGQTIADYVYSLEQATAGSGVQWLKNYGYFTEDYIAYSAPILRSVEASAHVTVGKNMFGYTLSDFADGTSYGLSAYLELSVPEGRYTISTDAPTGYIWGGTELGNNYVRVYSGTPNVVNVTTGKKILIGIVSSDKEAALAYHTQIERGSTVTAYEPYTETTYPLANITLRGILKTDADGNLYYDGDTYEWDGTVTRKYAEVAINGSSDWQGFAVGTENASAYIVLDEEPYVGTAASSKNGAISNTGVENGKYWSANRVNEVPDGGNMSFALGTSGGASYVRFCMTDVANITTLNAFKAAFPETQLQYLLATQTTESADPFTAVQTVEDGGTEEFVTTNGVPVGVVGRFANVAPISGHSLVNIYTGDTEGTAEATYTTDLQQLVYGGVFDAINGDVTETMDEIAEYDGETIGEPWLSSLDVYSQGATPTNGAQVVYTKTPTTFLIPPPTITTAKTYWWSDSGEVDWGYAMVGLGLMPVITLADPFE